VGVLVICVLVFAVFCIVLFMYIYSYLCCLDLYKDCCHQVTTQLQYIIIIIINYSNKRQVVRMRIYESGLWFVSISINSIEPSVSAT
jgi:hypothetical protein